MASQAFLDAFLGPVVQPQQVQQAPMQQPAPQAIPKPDKPMMQQQAPITPAPRDSGLRRFLGNLGDALLVANGGEPLYRQRTEQRQLGNQLAQYLGASDPGLAAILQENPQAGMALFNANRDDKRFAVGREQTDRLMGQTDRQLGQTDREIDERERANQASERLTESGQRASSEGNRISAATQLQIAWLRVESDGLDRQARAAVAAGDRQALFEIERLRHNNQLEIARLTGGDPAYDTQVEETTYPGAEARPDTAWFGDNSVAATPSRTVRTERQVPRQPVTAAAPQRNNPLTQAARGMTATRAEIQQYAQQHGMSVQQAEQWARSNGYAIQ